MIILIINNLSLVNMPHFLKIFYRPVLSGTESLYDDQSIKGKVDSKGVSISKKIKGMPTSASPSFNLSSKSTTHWKFGKTISFPTTFEEKKTLCDQFQVGDVIVTDLTGLKKIEKVDILIVLCQRAAKLLGRARKTADHSIVHIAIVVKIDKEHGRVLISEAMPSSSSGLRTVDLFAHRSCLLTKGMGYNYQVMRPTTAPHTAVAKEAARIGLRVSPKARYLRNSKPIQSPHTKIHKFSFLLALKAMFKMYDDFGIEAKKRLFKGILDEHLQSEILTGGDKPRKVFCSSFSTQLFQIIEAKQAWDSMLTQDNDLKQEFDQFVSGLDKDSPNAQKEVSNWARKMAEQHGQELEKKMKIFKVDFKFFSPQDFVEFFQRQKIIQPVFKLVTP